MRVCQQHPRQGEEQNKTPELPCHIINLRSQTHSGKMLDRDEKKIVLLKDIHIFTEATG